MCAVHSPMPRTSTSSLTTLSSESRATRSSSTRPSSTFSREIADRRRLRVRQPGAAQRLERQREHGLRRRRTVEERFEPTVDRGRGPARELLVTDHARELGEVRTARRPAVQLGNTVFAQHPRQHRIARARARAPPSSIAAFVAIVVSLPDADRRAARRDRSRAARGRRPRARRAARRRP